MKSKLTVSYKTVVCSTVILRNTQVMKSISLRRSTVCVTTLTSKSTVVLCESTVLRTKKNHADDRVLRIVTYKLEINLARLSV